ncbi:MAG: T9SS type A sorting domain-containing protein, partial [FCB group bacterium]
DNTGKDFWLTFHPCWENTGTGNALYIYVSSGVQTTVTLEVPGKGYFIQKPTIANDIIAFEIDPSIGQPYRKTDMVAPDPEKVYDGAGIHVYADQPIIVYGVSRFSYTSDSYLALPVSSLGKEYVVASWPDIGDNGQSFGQYLTSYCEIVAAYDDTKVRFTLGGTSDTRTAGGQKPGETTQWTLYKGDVLLFGSLGNLADLTGSHWSATKPVAAYSGNYCAYVPENAGYCDFMMEAELPVSTWGTEYHYTPIAGRLKNSMIRIFAKEDNTIIYSDGQILDTIKSGGGGLKVDAWISFRADNGTPRPIVFSANKPISVTQYNTGQTDDNIVSDPFQMALTPLEQYQKEIVFNTPGIKGGKGFNINWINIVYKTNDDGTMPDDLMFAQVVGGQFVWKKINSFSPDAGLLFRVPINGHQYACKQLLLPGDGVYKIKSDELFCVYAYGFSPYDSYGHPAFVGLKDLEHNDILPPDPQFRVLGNGTIVAKNNLNDATVEDMPRNSSRSNLAKISMDADSSFNYQFSYQDFIAGVDSATTWTGWVQNPTNEARLVVTFSDRCANDTTITIQYFPINALVTIRPDLDFGNAAIGDTVYKNIWIVNKSKMLTINIDSLRFKLQNQGFDILGKILPITIQPMDSVKYQVRFTATHIGTFIDSLGVNDTSTVNYKAQIKANVPFVNKDFQPPDPQWVFNNCTGSTQGIFSPDSSAIVEDMPQDSTRANLGTIKLNTAASFNFGLSSKDLVPVNPAIKTWKAWVKDLTKDARAVITFTDNVGNDTTITINYFAVSLSLQPDLDFGKLYIGDSLEKNLWVINNSKTGPVLIDSIQLMFKNKGFEVTDVSLPQIIPANVFMQFKISFKATIGGLFIDSVGVGDSCNFYFKSQVKAEVSDSINGVNDLNNANNSITIFPNPASNELRISYNLNANKKVTISIVDVLGNEVYSATEQGLAGTNNTKIDLSALPQGVYYLKLSSGAFSNKKILSIIR